MEKTLGLHHEQVGFFYECIITCL